MKRIFAIVLSILLLFSSLFIAANAADATVTEVPIESLKESSVLPERSTWTVTASSSWKWGPAENLLDGNVKTIWHSYYKEQDGKAVDHAPAPHTIDVELPEKSEITGFIYVPRQDNEAGYVSEWEIYSVTADGKEQKIANGTFPKSKNAKVISFDAISTDKIRVVFVKATSVATCAELYFLGKGENESLYKAEENEMAKGEGIGSGGMVESKALPPRNEWKITASSSWIYGAPEKMLDGKLNTIWHSYYKEQDGKAVDKTPAPYTIDIELPEECVVKGFTYMPRQDNQSGYVFNWEAYKVNEDGSTKALGSGSFANNAEAKSALWTDVSLKKIRIVFTKTTGVGTCAELFLIGKGENGVNEAALEKVEEKKENVNDKGWIVTASSEKSWAAGVKAMDGDLNTFWHTNYEEDGGEVLSHDMPPHDLKVTFPEKKVVTGFSIYPRQGSNSKAGIIEKYNFYVSDSDDGEYFLLWSGEESATASTKTVDFACAVEVKRAWLEILIGYSGYAVIAEFEFHEADENAKVVKYEDFKDVSEENRLYKIDPANFTVTDPDNTPTWAGKPGSLVDGSERGFWQTDRLEPGKVVFLNLDLGEVREFSHISILPRPSEDFHGYWEKFNVYISEDGAEYKELLYDYSFDEKAKSLSEKFIYFEDVIKARYVEFEITEYFNFRVSCAEISFWQNKALHDKTSDSGKYVLKIGSPEIEITKGGETYTKTVDVAPFITAKGSTLIPLRGLIEEMGMEIEWIDKTQEIKLSKGNRAINLQIRNKLVTVEGTAYGTVTYTLTSPPKIVNSRTFVPVRFLSEQMGYTVTWDGETKTITIEK